MVEPLEHHSQEVNVELDIVARRIELVVPVKSRDVTVKEIVDLPGSVQKTV